MKVIGVRRAEAGNLAASLRERGREHRVRVHDAADRRERAKERGVRGQVGRWPQLAAHDLTVHVGHDELRRRQYVIWHATWLDHDQALFTIDTAGVAEREFR